MYVLYWLFVQYSENIILISVYRGNFDYSLLGSVTVIVFPLFENLNSNSGITEGGGLI